jgi:predicted nucleic-acid-binding protein
MIAADTNLIIRHLTQDDTQQAEKVGVLFDQAELRQEPVLLNHIVLCEVCWVLKAVYGFEKPWISEALQALLDDGGFHIQDRPLVEESLALYKRHSGQFSDHLIGVANQHQVASTTYTFDKSVGKFPNFTLLK